MKKKILFILVCFFATISQTVLAQAELPEISTSEKPVWYYFQVKGTDVRKDRIFYLKGSDVYGELFSNVTTNRNRFLWRFEKNNDGSYAIICKQGNKKLDIRYDTDKKTNILTVADAPSVNWSLVERKGMWQIKSTTDMYAVQAGSSLEFVVSASSFGASDNATYGFLKYDNAKPEVSGEKSIYYYIKSADPSLSEACITDINETGTSAVKFKVQAKETDLDKVKFQQWKMIKPENVTGTNVFFVNRATGNIIQTAYDFNGYFNAQSTDNFENSNGWAITFLDFTQFKISGLDTNGQTGYLNASSMDKSADLIPAASDFVNSSYAWTFEVADILTSIQNPEPDPFDEVEVKIIDKRIYVDGTEDYAVYHISGIPVDKNVELPIGIYLVTIQGKTKSYLVK